MPAPVYHVMHVVSLLLLAGVTFAAFANPDPARRRSTLIWSGVLSLIALTGGMGLVSKALGGDWQPWVFLKIGCWLVLSGLAGIAFRKPQAARALWWIAAILIGVAVWAVYYRPFMGDV